MLETIKPELCEMRTVWKNHESADYYIYIYPNANRNCSIFVVQLNQSKANCEKLGAGQLKQQRKQ